eukprot:gnl/TRDRNA2_/TRDRNA2_153931_c0_seq1.p1 gnl/TRDRNA2_/TRDRNA2_153931_c0~~gnl/TRDRNA2_/TRDRNA2_153931_c0_seq1.p1  ORF type:complete len:549 (-),score=116.17 gnl/TRDRNA2_/TRDRNA2_153931_c0_seq1:103-1749(-)
MTSPTPPEPSLCESRRHPKAASHEDLRRLSSDLDAPLLCKLCRAQAKQAEAAVGTRGLRLVAYFRSASRSMRTVAAPAAVAEPEPPHTEPVKQEAEADATMVTEADTNSSLESVPGEEATMSVPWHGGKKRREELAIAEETVQKVPDAEGHTAKQVKRAARPLGVPKRVWRTRRRKRDRQLPSYIVRVEKCKESSERHVDLVVLDDDSDSESKTKYRRRRLKKLSVKDQEEEAEEPPVVSASATEEKASKHARPEEGEDSVEQKRLAQVDSETKAQRLPTTSQALPRRGRLRKKNAHAECKPGRPTRAVSAAQKAWSLPKGYVDVYRGCPALQKHRPQAGHDKLVVFAAPVKHADEQSRIGAEAILHDAFRSAQCQNALTRLVGLRPGGVSLRSGRKLCRTAVDDGEEKWLLWEQIGPEQVVGAAVLRRQQNTGVGPKSLRETLVLEYIAANRIAGGSGYPLVLAAAEVCRLLGFPELFSACDLSQDGHAFAGKATPAMEAHRRWGFQDIDPEEWQERRLDEYTRDSNVHFMVKQVPPGAHFIDDLDD